MDRTWIADLGSPMSTRKQTNRRSYGTGSLRIFGKSWVGSWYAPDGRKIRRKVGPARTPGERDGLTKAQAEERLRRMRDAERPVRSSQLQRVTMEQAGEELRRRLEVRGRKKSHKMTVESDLRKHIAPFFGSR